MGLRWASVVLCILLWTIRASAQDGTGEAARPEDPAALDVPPPADPAQTKIDEAKDLHKRGLQLLEAGDTERALAFFQRSRAAYPSAPNVTNIAICLTRLGRYDEALEIYELLLFEYAGDLAKEDRDAIAPAMNTLRAEVGSLAVSANVPATVVIDGRERGKLPLAQPIRVIAGSRSVRIYHPGFATFEARVEARAGEKVTLDARLRALENVGVVRVEAPSGSGAVVLLDGVQMGPAPWEGPTSLGPHIVQTIAGEQGSALTMIVASQGQISLARPSLAPLGPEIEIDVSPRSAWLEIDTLRVGAGTWTGRLPVGAHTVRLTELGYRTIVHRFESQVGAGVSNLRFELPIDPDHPRWPKAAAPGELWLGAHVGYAGGPGLAGDAAESCADACRGSLATHGGIFGGRGGYRFAVPFSLEIGAGYMLLASSFGRDLASSFGDGGEHPLTYHVEDEILVRGPFIATSASYRHPVASWLSLEGRAVFGVLFAAASDDYDASASAGDTFTELVTSEREVTRTVTIFVTPEVAAVAHVGAFDIGLSVSAPIFPLEGPVMKNGTVRAASARDPAEPGAASNAPASNLVSAERAWRPFAVVSPQLLVAYRF